MISVAQLVSDVDLGGQTVTVLRYQNQGSFQLGGYVEQPQIITLFGVVQPASPKELDMVPEGDRSRGTLAMWCTQQIFVTSTAGTSDLILWRGNKYRVMTVDPWVDGSFWHVTAVRIEGA